jgi:hypothetical protein
VRPVLLAALVALAGCAAEEPRRRSAPSAPVVVAGVPIPRAELDRRSRAFADRHLIRVAEVRAFVARQAIDERWAVRDAATLGVTPSEDEVDAAVARARRERGAPEAALRERVRGELAARAVGDHTLRTTTSDRAYGAAFLARHERRLAATACRGPYDPGDRCPGGRGERTERRIPLGVGVLVEYRAEAADELQIELAPLLGLDMEDPERAYATAARRLRRRAPRVRLQHSAYAVYVHGDSRADLVAAARVAHRMALGHPTPLVD